MRKYLLIRVSVYGTEKVVGVISIDTDFYPDHRAAEVVCCTVDHMRGNDCVLKGPPFDEKIARWILRETFEITFTQRLF